MGLDMYELPYDSLNVRLTHKTDQHVVPKDCTKYDLNFNEKICASFTLFIITRNRFDKKSISLFTNPVQTNQVQINMRYSHIRNKDIIYKWIEKFITYKISEENITIQPVQTNSINIILLTKEKILLESMQSQNINKISFNILSNFGINQNAPNRSNCSYTMNIQAEIKGPILEQISAFGKNQFIQHPYNSYDSKAKDWNPILENNAIDLNAKENILKAMAKTQKEFWQKKITRFLFICKNCFQKKHFDVSECKKKCRWCRYNCTNCTKFCINKIHSFIHEKVTENYIDDEKAWKYVYSTRLNCSLFKLNGYFNVQRYALYLVIFFCISALKKNRTGFKQKSKRYIIENAMQNY